MRKSNSTGGIGIFISILSLAVASLLFIFSQVLVAVVWVDAGVPAKPSKPQGRTSVAQAQEKTVDVSTVCDFSRLTAIEEWQRAALAKGGELEQITSQSSARYQAGLKKLKNVAEHAKASIIEAKQAFAECPSRKREADLSRANTEALASQFKALGGYRLASQAQLKTLGVFLGALKNGKADFEAQVDEIKQARETSLEKVAKAECHLDKLAVDIASLVGPDGELDPALAAEVEHLDWIRNKALQAGLEADVVQGQLEGQLREIELLEQHLLKEEVSLEYLVVKAVKLERHLYELAGRLRSS